RVYIDLMEQGDKIIITLKNISSYEMDFDKDEIFERFKRGDKSRNTEGSGLGLAIAKSILELQGGNLSIEVDGDLFKAKVIIPSVAIEGSSI
ncbi:MAG: GHKL domain-containing protein, partial [Clostridiaceae bacterium]|nr:GHKL domain-containing protein [Clostridiaceae bacterium]